MNRRLVLTWMMGVAAASLAGAQPNSFRATIRGGGGSEGKCTIEVVVDGAAEVEVRGDTAFLRNLWGQPPQWRRFVCNRPIPPRMADFRFKGIDGRGSQTLVRDPQSGGAAVVRIEDRQGGSEGYTFDLIWHEGTPPGPPPTGAFIRDDHDRDDHDRDDRFDRDHFDRDRLPPGEVAQICRDEVREQAANRFQSADINFRRVDVDGGRGREWVFGIFDVHGHGRPEAVYQFSCSVNFGNGRIRSVDIDPWDGRR